MATVGRQFHQLIVMFSPEFGSKMTVKETSCYITPLLARLLILRRAVNLLSSIDLDFSIAVLS